MRMYLRIFLCVVFSSFNSSIVFIIAQVPTLIRLARANIECTPTGRAGIALGGNTLVFRCIPDALSLYPVVLSRRTNWCRNCGRFITLSRASSLTNRIGAGLDALLVNSILFIPQRHRKIAARQIFQRGRPYPFFESKIPRTTFP